MEKLFLTLWVCVRSVNVWAARLTATRHNALILTVTRLCLEHAVRTTAMVRKHELSIRNTNTFNEWNRKLHSSTLGCSYAGKEYPNGQEFPHPTDSCRTCSCIVRKPWWLTIPMVFLKTFFNLICVVFVEEWECPVSDEEVSSAVVLKPKCAPRRLLPPVSW